MLSIVALVLLCVVGPLGVMWLTYKSPILRRVGDIIVAYVVGCAIGLSGLLPAEANETLTVIASASIPLAIPLMLLSSDVRQWKHLAPQFAKSLVLGVVGCAVAIVVGFLLFGNDGSAEQTDMNARVGGMLIGLYTGGTANQASLKLALGIPDSVYLVSHTYSIVISAVYLVLVIVFGRRLFGLILPPFRGVGGKADSSAADAIEDHSAELFWGLFSKSNRGSLGKAMGLTIGIVAVGGALAFAVKALVSALGSDADVFQPAFILIISILSALAAMRPQVRKIERTYEAGSYFILVFSFAVSAQVRTDMLANVDMGFLAFITVATLGALLFHVLFSALARIDTDTTLVSSIALICSPPFVPVMAGALGNKQVVGPGIAVGLIGYATGTYIGFGVAALLLMLV